ncbi:MAG: ATP-binding cassette domain-containing protein [Pseudomonadota bacterium]
MIEINAASFDYGGRRIFSDLELSIEPGSFHFLTGPSGSGKSTFLKLVYAALLPSKGSVHVFGRDTRGLERDELAALRRRIGIVQQEGEFLDHLTMSQNILLPVQLAKRSNSASVSDLADLLHWVGLADVMDAYPSEISGGERARAALARAIITGPELIIADEPTGNVDWEMAQRLVQLMVQLNKMEKTFIVATHDIGLIRSVKSMAKTRTLRLKNKQLDIAGADL